MPEVPDELEQYVADELANADGRMAQVPVGVLRGLHRDAHAFRRQTRQDGGQEAVDNIHGGLNPDGSTILLPGEADQTLSRRELFANAPPDRPVVSDPYQDADRARERVYQGGGSEKQALGAAFHTIVAAGIRGDKRVILAQRPGLTPATGSLGD